MSKRSSWLLQPSTIRTCCRAIIHRYWNPSPIIWLHSRRLLLYQSQPSMFCSWTSSVWDDESLLKCWFKQSMDLKNQETWWSHQVLIGPMVAEHIVSNQLTFHLDLPVKSSPFERIRTYRYQTLLWFSLMRLIQYSGSNSQRDRSACSKTEEWRNLYLWMQTILRVVCKSWRYFDLFICFMMWKDLHQRELLVRISETFSFSWFWRIVNNHLHWTNRTYQRNQWSSL